MLLIAVAACKSQAQEADERGMYVAKGVKPPRLANREEILKQRELLSQQLLRPGDSVMIKVYIAVNEQGLPERPEIKPEIEDKRLHDAAIQLVTSMRFQPAMEKGKPKKVLLTVPVMLVRK